MKLFATFILVIAAQAVFAQEDVVTRFFNQYEGKDHFTTIYITSKMFSMIAQIPEDENESDFMNLVRRLNGIRVLSSDSITDASAMYNKAIGMLDKNGFDDLMIVRDGTENIKFMVLEKGEVISDFVMLIGDINRFTLISLTGDLRLKDISKISKTMDIKGFDKLDKVQDKH